MEFYAEIWLPIAGHEGLYEVSDLGRVLSLPRLDSHGQRRGGRFLKPSTTMDGYKYVTLCRNGIERKRKIHHLVLEAFVGPCPPEMEARHGPNGPGDNRLSELCWGTKRENQGDRLRDGTDSRGKKCSAAKLTEADVIQIRQRAARGAYTANLAKQFGVSKSTVERIISGDSWRDSPGPTQKLGHARGEQYKSAKLTDAIVREVRTRHAAGETPTALAARFGVARATIRRAVNGQGWAHVD